MPYGYGMAMSDLALFTTSWHAVTLFVNLYIFSWELMVMDHVKHWNHVTLTGSQLLSVFLSGLGLV